MSPHVLFIHFRKNAATFFFAACHIPHYNITCFHFLIVDSSGKQQFLLRKGKVLVFVVHSGCEQRGSGQKRTWGNF